MKKLVLGIYFLILVNASSSAQVVWGTSIGVSTKQTTSPPFTTQTKDIIVGSNVPGNPRIFVGIYLETNLLKGLRIKQELAIYPTQHSYKLLVPNNDPNSHLLYFGPVTSIGFTTLNYRALLRIIKKRNFSIKIGPSIDLDFVKTPYRTSYYAPNYPEAIELEKSLEDSYNLATLYADVELSHNWKRLDLAVNYKYSLTSQTGKFVYDGNLHNVRSTSKQLFFRIGYRFIVNNQAN